MAGYVSYSGTMNNRNGEFVINLSNEQHVVKVMKYLENNPTEAINVTSGCSSISRFVKINSNQEANNATVSLTVNNVITYTKLVSLIFE